MGSPDEVVAVVDTDGVVTGRAPRWLVRRDNLRHISTAVLVRHPDGRIYVHRRSADKDWQPSAYDAAAGGVLRHGEPVEESARRELAEELGISGIPLRALARALYEDATVRCVTHCFETTYDGMVTHVDGEVVWGGWMTLPELGVWLRVGEPPFVPDTRALLQRLCRGNVRDYGTLGLPAREERS